MVTFFYFVLSVSFQTTQFNHPAIRLFSFCCFLLFAFYSVNENTKSVNKAPLTNYTLFIMLNDARGMFVTIRYLGAI